MQHFKVFNETEVSIQLLTVLAVSIEASTIYIIYIGINNTYYMHSDKHTLIITMVPWITYPFITHGKEIYYICLVNNFPNSLTNQLQYD